MAENEGTKRLVLHIEVPGIYADDLPQAAKDMSGGDFPNPDHYLFVVIEEWMREEVGLTVVTLPGEKNLNEDFQVHAYNGRIVGAEVRDAEDD